MQERIPTPAIGEIILEEFMNPLNMNVSELAGKLGLSERYMRAILDGEVKITPEISRLLSSQFGMSELFFYRLQKNIDARNSQLGNETLRVRELQYA